MRIDDSWRLGMLAALAAAIFVPCAGHAIAPAQNDISYQGLLEKDGSAAAGPVDLKFRLFNAPTGGAQVGPEVVANDFDAFSDDGRFTIDLNFGTSVFDGSALWLEVQVGNTTLSPRQEVTHSPYAIRAQTAGAVEPQGLTGPYPNALSLLNPDNVINGTFSGTGAGLTNLNASEISTGTIANTHTTGSSVTTPNSLVMRNEEGYVLELVMINGHADFFHAFSLAVGHTSEAPGGTISVMSPEFVAMKIQRLGNGVGGAAIRLINDVQSGRWDVAVGNNDDFAIFDADSEFGSHFVIKKAGGVGIGATNVGSMMLAVNGDAAKPGGGSWANFSDARLKREIVAISKYGGMLDRLVRLNGYEFEYDESAIETRFGIPGRQIGLLAQEVQEVFPNWVKQDHEGYLYVTERGVTAIFIEALRELRIEKDAQIEELRAEKDAEIAALRDELAQLQELVQEVISSQRGVNR